MDRNMSYELDDVFASRNAGELVSVAPARQRIVRSSGLTQVSNLPLGTRLGTPKTRRLDPPMSRRIPSQHARRIAGPQDPRLTQGRPTVMASGLADAYSPMDGLGLTLPIIGTVSWGSLAVGAAIGLAMMAIVKRR